MFGHCCGRSKKLDVESLNRKKKVEIDNYKLEVGICQNKDDDLRSNSAPSIIVDQPVQLTSILKRQSVISDHKIEDDDEVFCEGVSDSIKLANNLGTPTPYTAKVNEDVSLPRWFSDQEVGGTQEPPATPIGRDELAMRRHRFFSDLLSASQNASEHKVWFDPLGPVVASDQEYYNNFSNDLDSFVSRLEVIADRLEIIFIPICELLKQNSLSLLQSNLPNKSEETPNMSVIGYQDLIQGSLAAYVKLSKELGGDVAEHALIVEKAFQAQLQFLVMASQSRMPSQSEQICLLQPTSQQISAIQEFREKHRSSPFFNHLSAISESIPALGWVTVSPTPGPYVKEMLDAGQFYTNRVLKDFKEKDKKHVDWVKAWVGTLTELQAFVKQHHTTGLVWAGKNAPVGVPPPPPGCPPPPPSLADDFSALDVGGNDRSALFAQINQGENITKNLKKVTADMQTHKNPTLRTGPAPFIPPQSVTVSGVTVPSVKADKQPSFQRDGKKWLIEYQKGNHNLVVDNAEMNNVVYLFKCTDSTVTVKGKLNSITLDSCKKTSIVFESLVSSIEFINCQSVQMQASLNQKCVSPFNCNFLGFG
ncbi:hypothetical protein RI129_011971 [Pyrocoelia pectoralis]|uniref:Adenylyl cyclase-associated protein n=1 Tax=Pyrocoelia pectoralis TaxID=417401 RepID=A0AAN7V8Y3_9COLE